MIDFIADSLQESFGAGALLAWIVLVVLSLALVACGAYPLWRAAKHAGEKQQNPYESPRAGD